MLNLNSSIKYLILFSFFLFITGLSTSRAQESLDTLQKFSNQAGDAKHHRYTTSLSNVCAYGYTFGHSCYEWKEFAEKFTLNDTAVIEGMFGYIASDDDTVKSKDSAAFNIYKDSANYPGDQLTGKKISFQDLTLNSTLGINTKQFNNFTLAMFSDSIVMQPDSSFFASFKIPEYTNNYSQAGSHEDTLTLRTSKDDPSINARNVVRQKNDRWLEAEMFAEKSVYYYLAPIVNTNLGSSTSPIDSSSNGDDTISPNQVRDTVHHFSFDPNNVSHYKYNNPQGSCDYGYVFGHSCQEFQGFAERFTFSDSVHVEGLFAYMVSEDNAVTSNDSVTFSLHDSDGQTPGQKLTEEVMAIADLKVNDTTGGLSKQFTNFTYQDFSDTTIIPNNSAFFSALKLPDYESNAAMGSHEDTLALRTSNLQPGNQVTNAIQKQDGTWAATETATNNNLKVNMFLAPVINTKIPEVTDNKDTSNNSSVKPLIKRGSLGLVKSYPNPAKKNFNIQFMLDQPMPVNIQVFTIKGRHVKQKQLGRRSKGTQTVEIQVGSLSNGQYIYTLQTPQGILSGKMNKQ